MSPTVYALLKLVHILLAIAAVGYNATYGLLIGRAGRDRAALSFALRTIKFMDDRIANPAYVLLLVTGIGLAHGSGRSITGTPWILHALVLLVVALLIAVLGYTPTLRRQIELLEREGPDHGGYKAASRRGALLGGLLFALALAILTLMVVQKPA
jgi:uncharacterized membrane protein